MCCLIGHTGKIAARLERPADAEQSAGVTDSLTKVRDGGWVGEVEEGLCYRDATHLKLKMLHYSWSRTFARQFAFCSTILLCHGQIIA